MFAVPGWSISAKSLKTETESSRPAADNSNPPNPKKRDETKSKKRKRGQDGHSGAKVTSENLEELWKRHIQPSALLQQVNGISDRSDGRRTQSKKERKKASRKSEPSPRLEAPTNSDAPKANEAAEPKNDSRKEEDGLVKYEKRMAKARQKQNNKSLQHSLSGPEPQKDDRTSEIERTSAFDATGTLPTPRKTPISAEFSKVSTQHGSLTDGVKPEGGDSSKNATTSPLAAPPNPKLTSLQQRMAQKLVSARFRHLNETLYTSPSAKAMALFTSSPQAYGAYHAGFRAQVSVWPSNPVDQFVQEIRERGAVRPPVRNGYRNDRFGQRHFKGRRDKPAPPSGGGSSSTGIEPLPRHPTTHICHIADLGCGDAVLAASLSATAPQNNNRLKLSIRSFDLAAGDGPHASLVSVADITNLRPAGVADGSINLAICCLSLMSTNWVRVVDECARVVHSRGGEVWVAEIRSRFVAPGRGRGGSGRRDPGTPLLHGAAAAEKGAKKKQQLGRDPAGRQADDEIEEAEYFSDLEDQQQQQQQRPKPAAGAAADDNTTTDVSAFVDVWRRRGFTLKGDPDMRNKMFVTMRFVKERWSARPKGGDGEEGGEEEKGREESKEKEEEGKVLKPCLYKTR